MMSNNKIKKINTYLLIKTDLCMFNKEFMRFTPKLNIFNTGSATSFAYSKIIYHNIKRNHAIKRHNIFHSVF